ncbi:spore coat protein U domain-containing protein [Marinovum sp. KMM 9989]
MFTKSIASAMCLTCMTAFATTATAAETTSNLGVIAVVADTCILAAGTALSFATINTGQASNQATPGVVTVTCTSTKDAISVTVGGGAGASGGSRHMKTSEGDVMKYSIHSDSGHASEVGIDGTLYSQGVTAAVPKLIPVYGQIPAGNYKVGAYTDTLLVTLNYTVAP